MDAERIRFLFIGANPRDTSRLRIDKEHRLINNVIRSSKLGARIELRTELALPASELVSVIRRTDPTVIHFSGHGGEEGIVLEDENGEGQMVSPEALTNLFGGFPGKISCVILNSCFSFGLAERLVNQSQVACVIGISTAIRDEEAIAFVNQLYQLLCDGEIVTRAIQLVKMSLRVSGVENTDIIHCVIAPGIDTQKFDLEAMVKLRSVPRAPAFKSRVPDPGEVNVHGSVTIAPEEPNRLDSSATPRRLEQPVTRDAFPAAAANSHSPGIAEMGTSRPGPQYAEKVGTADPGASQTPALNGAGESADAPALFGQGLDLRREAKQHELCLSVDQYVDALATVLGQAEGELCFALYGNWGRGKTTLAQRLCEALRQKSDAPRYRTIWFNAWKYRSPPEVWAHLYERMARGLSGDGWLSALPRVLRANLSRRGLGIITFALLWLAISLVPIGDKVALARKLIVGVVGSLGLVAIWAGSAVYKTSSVTRRIWQLYASLPSHEDKLGLQAAIGGDLLYLLRGWIPRSFYSERAKAAQSQRPAQAAHARLGNKPRPVDDGAARDHSPGWGHAGVLALMVLAVGAVSWLALGHVTNLPLWVRWAVPAVWDLSCLSVSLWVWRGGLQVDRLLIVIDDLDRCPQEQMLDILEAIKLLAEEPGIRERLQVLVLVDEDILGQAIQHRFRHLREPGTLHTQADLSREVRDHLRKLFLGNLRLGPLSSAEVSDLVARYTHMQPGSATSSKLLTQKAEPRSASGPGQTDGLPPFIASDRLQKSRDQPAIDAKQETKLPPGSSAEARIAEDVLFTPAETKILTSYTQRLLQSRDAERLGPRTIRSFIFRYQLARLLLRSLRIEADANAIAEYLYYTTDMADRQARRQAPERALPVDAQRVLAQVAELALISKGGEQHQDSISTGP